MVNKSFKQNSLIKYTSILLLNLILVLSMGVTNIFGDLSEIEKTTRVNKAVEAAKTERSKQEVSDKEVTDDNLTTEAKNQVDKSDDTQNTQEKVTEAATQVVTNYKNTREQIIKKAVEEAQKERTAQKLSVEEVKNDELRTAATQQAKNDDPNKRTQEAVTAAAKKFVSDKKEDKIKTAIQAAQQVILADTDPISNSLVFKLGDESVYNAYKNAAIKQANHEDANKRAQEQVNEETQKVAQKQLEDAKTARDEKVDTVLNKVKIKSLQDKYELTPQEEQEFKKVAKEQAENINEAENTEAKVESVVLAQLDSLLKKKQGKKDSWVNQAVREAIKKAVNSKKTILTQNYRNAAINASVSKTAKLETVTAAAEKVVDNQEETQEAKTTNTTGKQPEHKTGKQPEHKTGKQPEHKTGKQPEHKTRQVQENTPVDVNTVVTGDLGEQAAELTDETAKAAVQKKYSNLQIDQVTVKVDIANKQVTVSAIDNSQVYTGTATVKYTVKAATSDKPWYKSVVLWVSVGLAFAVAAVGVVYYLNKNKKFKK